MQKINNDFPMLRSMIKDSSVWSEITGWFGYFRVNIIAFLNEFNLF